MAWVVTGVAGFIGSSLAHHLAAASVEVRGIDDLSSGRLENVPDACQLTVGSICSAPLEELFEGADVVVHLAAQVSVPATCIPMLPTSIGTPRG